MKRPEGLWPVTELVLDQIELIGSPVLKIEPQDLGEVDGVDFLWGKLTPHLGMSDGEYMRIDQEFGEFSAAFGQRGCSGGDPTWGDDLRFLQPTTENAELVARAFCDYFTVNADA
ncbi:hypothetical protein KBJ94_23640 [Pseudomonas sp. ITA]|uniref:hypothetical protein n=1 Tax=Pseudomonas sp. ITA TaxID=2825841 RepID=UPI002495F874|nr:hypothetical protein [Pseudomonas sp. ITA]MDI2145044.1 hypothetical protein [Pseudomonas sp. ITA]